MKSEVRRYSNVKNPRKLLLVQFLPENQASKFPASTTPNEIDRVIRDWWRLILLQEHLKAKFYFLLDWRLHYFSNFGLFAFCRRKLRATTETTVTWASRIWQSSLVVTTHSETQTLFFYWLTVTFVGRSWSRNFKVRS